MVENEGNHRRKNNMRNPLSKALLPSCAMLCFIPFAVWSKTKPLDVKEALFASKVITTKTKGHAAEVKANVKGAKNLYLVMADGGDSHSCD